MERCVRRPRKWTTTFGGSGPVKLGNVVNPEVKADSLFSHLELPNKLEYYDDFADATHLIPGPARFDTPNSLDA